MKHLFYLVGIALIIYEILWLSEYKKRIEESKKVILFSKSGNKHNKESARLALKVGIPALILWVWIFTGILTFNWIAFVLFIFYNVAIISPINSVINNSSVVLVVRVCNTILFIVFALFVTINSYHLKIDLYKMLSSVI